MTLNEAILSIVNENSGGVKFTKLVTALVCMNMEGNLSDVIDTRSILGDLVERCKGMSEIKLLEYSMPLGDDVERLKMFVYIPLS